MLRIIPLSFMAAYSVYVMSGTFMVARKATDLIMDQRSHYACLDALSGVAGAADVQDACRQG